MSKTLFVGGLSWDTTDEGLRVAFEEYGPLSEARVISDRDTGRSRGFGFVIFDSTGDADKAMSEMDGATLDGRKLRVNEAEDRRDGGDGGAGNSGGGGRW